MGAGVRYGFAVNSTNTGHNGTGANSAFALNSPDAKLNWLYHAMHGSIVVAEQVVQLFYAKPPSYSYYSGYSTGGCQGFRDMQMFPDDFDALLIGAPAWWHSHLQTRSIKVGLYNQPITALTFIPPSLFPVIGAEVIGQCDGTDGLVDGIVSDRDPATSTPKPSSALQLPPIRAHV